MIPRLAASGPQIVVVGGKAVYDNGNSGAEIQIDWRNGGVQTVLLSEAAPVLQIYRGLTPGESARVMLGVRQDAAGNRVPVLQAASLPAAGIAYSTGAFDLDFLELLYDGSLIFATLWGKGY